MNPLIKGLLLVSLGTTLFSSKSILIQLAYQAGATVDQLMLIRMIIALPFYILIGVFAWRKLENTPSLKTIVLIALPGFACYHIASYLDMWALQFLTAGLERIVLFNYPVFVVLIKACQGERISKTQLAGLFVAYVGVVLFFYQDLQLHEAVSLIAVLAVLGAAVLTAFYMIASQKYGRQYSSDLFTAIAMGVTGLTIPSHYVFVHGVNVGEISQQVWIYGALLSIVFTVLASVVLNRGVHIVGAVTGSVAGMLGPMITLVLASFILGQAFTFVHAVATIITIIGVSVVTQPTILKQAHKFVMQGFSRKDLNL